MPSVIEHIEAGAQRLDHAGVSLGQGTLNTFDEAAWLVLWALDLPLDSLDLHQDRPVASDESAKIATLFDKRITQRIPTAYLTREAWLQGVPFYVDERSIVPRSFIAELLADGGIEAWLPFDPHDEDGVPWTALDLCTGNGSLAVLAALAWPTVQVTGADISSQALEVARINVSRHGLDERVRLVQGDGFESAPGPYDLILCNPPYVNATSMAALPPEFQAEPALALAGGKDGMDFVRRLIQQARAHLSPHGVLVLEIGHEREHFEAAFAHLSPIWLDCSAGADQVLLLEQGQLPGA